MCGIAGLIDFNCSTGQDELLARAEKMIQPLEHRGPDDAGLWIDVEAGIALGFRRLAIIDCTPTGHQPMLSHDGRFIIVFNGEIYNFQSLRKQLERQGTAFRGHADTEVLLGAISHWGLEKTLAQLNGMFAFALWDRQQRQLHLVRDRLGEKPLYYGWCGSTFLFGSELKALRAEPAFQAEIDRNVLTLYLRHNCIPAPYSIYKNIFKLPPASSLTVKSNTPSDSAAVPYWSARTTAAQGLAQPLKGSSEEILEAAEALLKESVAMRMVADVPLGAFLSGGIDSSLIVALMQAQSATPVKTFTIGFTQERYNEAPEAKAIADRLGANHTELCLAPQQALAVIPELAAIYDEPFSDSSQIPTLLVSRLARQQVAASLSGDGGDEVFGGYNRYLWAPRIWKTFGWLPHPARAAAAALLRPLSPQHGDWLFQMMAPLLPPRFRQRHPGHNLQKLAEVLAARHPLELYRRLASHWQEPKAVVRGGMELEHIPLQAQVADLPQDFAAQMMLLDTTTFLPDDILVKLDRASMSASLEARVPYLDHRVVEFAWQLPLAMKIRNGQGKWLLRQLLAKYIPPRLTDRPKTGFAIPLGDWLRGPLRDWAEALIDPGRLWNEGFFQIAPIQQKWREHLSGRRNWEYLLWDILMFQAWLDVR